MLGVAIAEGSPEEVYVVVTVSVTPVGKVVILGVEVVAMDDEGGRDAVALPHRDTGGDLLDDCDFEITLEEVSLTDMRLVELCRGVRETVGEDDCDRVGLLEGVYETEELAVLELLDEAVMVCEGALLILAAGLFVAEFVAVVAGEAVGLFVSLALEPVVTVSDGKGEGVLVPATDAVTVVVRRSVEETLLETEADAETLGVFVCVAELDTVCVPGGVRVILIDAVAHVDAVEVFDADVDLEKVVDAEPVFVGCTDRVVVFVAWLDPVIVVLPVEVLELDTLLDPVGEAVDVFEEDTDCVPVTETSAVLEAFVVFVNDGDAEEVFEGASVLVSLTLPVLVLEACADLVVQGLVDAVFELETEPVPVFVGATERVDVVDSVAVLEDVSESVPRDVELAVLETVVLRVVV